MYGNVIVLNNVDENIYKFTDVTVLANSLSRYRGFHDEDETVVRPSYIYQEKTFTCKTAFLYWHIPWRHGDDKAPVTFCIQDDHFIG